MKGADGNVYAVAQGSLEIQKAVNGKEVKTVASIKGGAVVERSITPDVIFDKSHVQFVLKNPDYGVADRIIKAIEKNIKQ